MLSTERLEIEGVRAVVFGRRPSEIKPYFESVVYLSVYVTKRQAAKMFGSEQVQPAGEILRLGVALAYFGPEGGWSDAFDYVDRF